MHEIDKNYDKDVKDLIAEVCY